MNYPVNLNEVVDLHQIWFEQDKETFFKTLVCVNCLRRGTKRPRKLGQQWSICTKFGMNKETHFLNFSLC